MVCTTAQVNSKNDEYMANLFFSLSKIEGIHDEIIEKCHRVYTSYTGRILKVPLSRTELFFFNK